MFGGRLLTALLKALPNERMHKEGERLCVGLSNLFPRVSLVIVEGKLSTVAL